MQGKTRILAGTDFPPTEIVFATLHRGRNGGLTVRNVDFEKEALSSPVKAPNLALLFQRYLPAHDEAQNYDAPTEGGVDLRDIWTQAKINEKRKVSDAAKWWKGEGVLRWFVQMARDQQWQYAELLPALHKRRRDLLAQAGRPSELVHVTVTWRLATGLANPSPIKNSGWAFNHTYGFPVLPEASLKGLANHYLRDEKNRPRQADFLFGSPAGERAMGVITFLEGWPCVAGPWFEVEVLTPHHPDYYGNRGHVVDDKPEPHHFLTLIQGTEFEIPLAITDVGRRLPESRQKEALHEARSTLVEALCEWGCGAKTGSGYGRMKETP